MSSRESRCYGHQDTQRHIIITMEGDREKENPRLILLFSGKRKSGKDFVTDLLQEHLGSGSVILRLSGPLKECYAREHGLDFEKMLSASDYKEKYRLDMINWSTKIRNDDYTYFCKAAEEKYEAKKYAVWIISDCRRQTDVKYFLEKYQGRVKTVRITASDEARSSRGWKFTEGIDDMETECGLDKLDHDIVLDNSEGDGTDVIRRLIENTGARNFL